MPTLQVISLLVRVAGPATFICRCTIWAAPTLLALAAPGLAEKGKLRERLTPDVMAVVYSGAERLGPQEGSPPAIAVYDDDKAVAYIFSTLDIIGVNGVQAIFVASNGPYDFVGTKHYRESEGRRFDRSRIVPGWADHFLRARQLSASRHRRAGMRAQQNAGLFALPANAPFEPVRPWRFELLVNGTADTKPFPSRSGSTTGSLGDWLVLGTRLLPFPVPAWRRTCNP